jgi:hypothetical protein
MVPSTENTRAVSGYICMLGWFGYATAFTIPRVVARELVQEPDIYLPAI